MRALSTRDSARICSARSGPSAPAVELHSIDDVPFLTLTLWSERLGSSELRPLAAELARELSEIPETSKAALAGRSRSR